MKLYNWLRCYNYNGFVEMMLHNCQQGTHRTSSKVVADAIRRYSVLRLGRLTLSPQSRARTPAGLFAKTCIFATLLPFPVVKAWSWSAKEKSTDQESPFQRFSKNLRFMNVKMSAKERMALAELLYKADDLYSNGDPSEYQQILTMLNEHRDKKEPELQWRIARLTYEMAKQAKGSKEQATLMENAFELITAALEIDEGNFAVHKWMAILLNEVSVLKGLTEQITQSFNVKKHIMRAVELNPNDATSHYMLGNWCYTVAEVPWYQRKVAATIFATPPESSFTEALVHFKDAEKLKPDFYSMNHLMLAKTYIQLGDLNNAAPYLKLLEKRKVRTDEDFNAKMEASDLIKKHFKSQKHFEEVLRTIRDVEVQ